MKTNPTRILLSLVLLTGVTMANAATYTWSGATNNTWDTGTNWEGGTKPPSGSNNDIVFDTNTGMGSGYSVAFATSTTIGSLTVDISQLSIIGTATRTLAIGDASKAGQINITSALTKDSILFTNGTSPRLKVEFANEIKLTNNGTGQASFGNARLQNGNGASQTGIVRFQGSGDWAFLANSYLGKSIDGGGNGNEVSVVLQGGSEDAFSGTLRYAASTAMDVAQLQVNSGTFRLESSTVKASEGVHVGEGGTFNGSGTIEGNVLVDGNLVTGFGVNVATLTVNGDLTLSDTAETSLRVFSSSADRISGTGILSLDGVLVIDVAPEEIAGIVLYDGFSVINGYFSGVLIGDTALSQISAGEWGGVVAGYEWSFLSETGVLSSTIAVPEPALTGALLAAGALCAAGPLCRTRRRRSGMKA